MLCFNYNKFDSLKFELTVWPQDGDGSIDGSVSERTASRKLDAVPATCLQI